MALTNRQKWPLPAKDIDPWYDPFVTLVNAMDASSYASREDRNTVWMGGGQISFNSTTGVVTWASSIQILAAVPGFYWTLAAGNITLSDGEFAYVELTRYPSNNVVVTLTKASNLSLASADNALVFAVRRGTRVYFRDGKVINNGESIALFETAGASIGVGGQKIRRFASLASSQSTDQSTYQTVSAFALNPTDLAVTGTTVQLFFMAMGSVSLAALTGSIRLYNLSDLSVVHTHTFNGVSETSPTKKITTALSLPASEKIYEVRIAVTGGTPPADKVFCWWAGLVMDNLF